MRTIHKFRIPGRALLTPSIFEAELPVDSRILTAQVQDRPLSTQASMWYETETTNPTVIRRFATFWTGKQIILPRGSRLGDHIATIQTGSGLVFHLYEIL